MKFRSFLRAQVPIYWLIFCVMAVAILFSLYNFLWAKQYEFYVEAPCGPSATECYSRDCSGGDCPPNNLTEYRVFAVPASRFSECTDNTCANICSGASSPCSEVACSTQSDITCITPTAAK